MPYSGHRNTRISRNQPKITHMNSTGETVIPDQLLSVARVQHLIGATDSTLRSWVRTGKIPPPMRLGGRLFWRPETIDEWLRSAEEKPIATAD